MKPLRTGHVIGVHPDSPENYFDTVQNIAQTSEAVGLDAIFFSDHFQVTHTHRFLRELRRVGSKLAGLKDLPLLSSLLPETEKTGRGRFNSPNLLPVLECFTTLGALAASTKRIGLGALVAGVPYRNPALLAKINLTLDVISHGRCIVGLGAGWLEEEFHAYGWPFPAVKERMDRLEEAVHLIDLVLRQQDVHYEGRYYQAKGIRNNPGPVQTPRPPLLIGGSGEQRTLAIVARYADYCNLFGDPETLRMKHAALQRHCEAIGRPWNEILVSNFVGILIAENETTLKEKKRRYKPWLGAPISGLPDQVTAGLQAYIDAGTNLLIFNFPDAQDLEPIHLFSETVVPNLVWPPSH